MSLSVHAARSLLRDIQLNVLECKVCFEIYSDSAERRPCVLSCGHAVCRQCAGALSHMGGRQRQQQLQCPFCRRCGPAAQATDCLPLLQLAELLSPVAESSSSSPSNSQCPLSTQPRLTAVLGGWGKLFNPRALAVCPSSGALAVADDGDALRLWERGEDSLQPAASASASASAGFSGLLYPLGVALAGRGLLLVVADGGDSSLKVFARGEGQKPKTVQGGFALPWGVAAGPGSDQVALTDSQRGTLFLLSLHLPGGGLLSTETVSEGLHCPREVAVCPLHCCIHVVEHLQPLPPSAASTSCIRLKTFNSRRQLIRQLDSTVFSPARLPAGLSAIAADGRGNVLVADGLGATVGLVEGIAAAGTVRYRVLIAEGLVRPAGLACTADGELVVLDSGDHTCKIYTAPEVP